jgi:O-antigen ligase
VIALWLCALALLIGIPGGGMLDDRVIPAPDQTSLFGLFAVPLATALAGIALTLSFWTKDRDSHRRSLPYPAPLIPALFGFMLFWAALSLMRSGYLYASVCGMAIMIGAMGAGAAIAQSARTRSAVLAFALALTGIGAVVAGIGLNEYLWNLLKPEPNPLWRVFATFVMPNFLAGFLVMTLPVALALFLTVRERNLSILTGLAAVLQTFCLLLTQSRLGLLSLVIGMALFTVLAIRGGVLIGSTRRRAMLLAGLAILAIIASGPLARRLFTSGGEAYSGRFRLLTWQGTNRMAQANPLFGTGFGTFETAYPRYAILQFTQHAHNSYIQLAGEIGYPGMLFLVIGLTATLAVGTTALNAARWRARALEQEEPDTVAEESAISSADSPTKKESAATRTKRASQRSRTRHNGASPAPPAVSTRASFLPSLSDLNPQWMLIGLIAGIVGALAHNFFDSDLYVPANALTMGAMVGLTLAAARLLSDPLPLGTEPKPASPRLFMAARFASAAAAALLLMHAVIIAGGRAYAYDAAGKLNEGMGARAVESYREAIALDRWNPEYRLSLALIYEGVGQMDAARGEYERAIRAAPIGKAYYRYGRFLARRGQYPEAITMLEQVRTREPRNLNNLLALAEACTAAGRAQEAESVYSEMLALYRSPFGAVRPLPELVDWEFGFAYLGLAEAQLARGDRASAEENLREGAGILGEFWRTRHLEAAAIRVSAEVRRRTADRYDWALEQWAKTLEAQNRPKEAAQIVERRNRFRAEREEEANRAQNTP